MMGPYTGIFSSSSTTTCQSNNKAVDRRADQAHISRLQHILGGKSRRAFHKAGEDVMSGRGKCEEANRTIEPRNAVQPIIETVHLKTLIDSPAEDDVMHDVVKHNYMVGDGHSDDLGLEIAMKQLMEATHDALVNMKAEILRMQYELERALVEISLLRQREDLLQHEFKDRALELERDFMRRIDDLRQTTLLELIMSKEEMKETHKSNDGMTDGAVNCLQNPTSVSGQFQDLEPQCSDSIPFTSRNEYTRLKVNNLHNSLNQRAPLTERMLQRISPKRLEQSVAAVRGWLQSPTPSESSSLALAENGKSCYLKQQLSNLPMPNLVDSLKEEAKLCATHRRAISMSQTKASNAVFDIQQTDHLNAPSITKSADLTEVPVSFSLKPSPEPCFEEMKTASPVSVLDATMQDYKEMPLLMSPVTPDIYREPLSFSALYEYGSYVDNSVSSQTECHLEKLQTPLASPCLGKQPPPFAACQVEKKLPSSLAPVQERGPPLRILKPENFKIADFLVSDSEEEFTV